MLVSELRSCRSFTDEQVRSQLETNFMLLPVLFCAQTTPRRILQISSVGEELAIWTDDLSAS
ncbi:hypothetical protein CS542_08655 [Pedobacter sp. IW39]|nr:hypothetical protein CS542_08655 [Pedobacter sp. IW39]